MSNTTVDVHSLDGIAALWRTFEYLFVHGIIIVLVTAAAVGLARLATRTGKPGWLDLGAYCGAFATFGVATAYFLSLGLSPASSADNGLLQTFVGPFISLLTAAVAYAASKKTVQIAKNDLVLGVTCFLLSCILSYETFNGQIRYGMGSDPDTTVTAPPNGSGENELEPPTDGNRPAANSQAAQGADAGGPSRTSREPGQPDGATRGNEAAGNSDSRNSAGASPPAPSGREPEQLEPPRRR